MRPIIILLGMCLIAGPAIALPPEVKPGISGSRLYKLCLMEDEACVPTLIYLYTKIYAVGPALFREQAKGQTFCAPMPKVECIWRRFMMIAPSYVQAGLSAEGLETQVIASGDPCVCATAE